MHPLTIYTLIKVFIESKKETKMKIFAGIIIFFIVGGICSIPGIENLIFFCFIIIGVSFWIIVIMGLITNSKEEKIEKEKELAKKRQDELDREKKRVIGEYRNQLRESKKLLHSIQPEDLDYPEVLYNTGILFEKGYNDYLRAACHCYLAWLACPNIEIYLNDYIRLYDLYIKNNGKPCAYEIRQISSLEEIEIIIKVINGGDIHRLLLEKELNNSSSKESDIVHKDNKYEQLSFDDLFSDYE